AVAQRCFEETATIGLRTRHEARLTLPRTLSADTPGAVRTKTVTRPGGTTVKAESDDIAPLSGLAARRAARAAAEGTP
ncbi:MAG: nickel insertion protein, partial [Pseudomonadota bacterium]